jgi:mycothiol system anti-sigma-R factor
VNCRDVQKFVYVYLDEEFDKRDSLEFEAHVSQCNECRSMVRAEEHFRLRLKNQLRCQPAPAALRDRIVACLQEVELTSCELAMPHSSAAAPGRRHRLWMGSAIAASLAAIAAFNSSSTLQGALRPSSVEGVASTASLHAFAGLGLEATLESQATEAVHLHKSDLPADVPAPSPQLDHQLRDYFGWSVSPPLPENFETRLMGARFVSFGGAKSVLYTYDHRGRKVSVVQTLIPASEPSLVHARRVIEFRELRALLVGQSESVLVSVISDLPVTEAMKLVAMGPQSL